MDYNITQEEFNEIEDLVMKATQAYTKADASYYIKQLKQIRLQFFGYPGYVFSDLIGSVEAAAGQVADKERKMYFVNQDLEKLRFQIGK